MAVVHINGQRTVVSDGDRITADGATISVRCRDTHAVTRFEAPNLPRERGRPAWPHESGG
jgi:hypothetical protein